MGLFVNENKLKSKIEADLSKKFMQEIKDTDFIKHLFPTMYKGMTLTSDSNMGDYVKEGYNKSPDGFSIVNKLAQKASAVPIVVEDQKGNRIDDIDIMIQPNHWQTFAEWRYEYHIFSYVTGNSLVYLNKYDSGMDKGKVYELNNIPTHKITPIYDSWKKPIKGYKFQLSDEPLPIEDVWHHRLFPNIDYNNGSQYMGQSPFRVAAAIIEKQNNEYALLRDTTSQPIPPSIIARDSDRINMKMSEQNKTAFEQTWQERQSSDKKQIPMPMLGKVSVHKLGFDNMKDMQILESSVHGRRILCNILGVPAEIMNDKEASIYNNVTLAWKAAYTDRILPDVQAFCDRLNIFIIKKINPAWTAKPDTSEVEALQQDIKYRAEIEQILINAGVHSPDEARVAVGDQETGEPAMQQRYIGMSQVPIGQALNPEESEKYLNENEISIYGE